MGVLLVRYAEIHLKGRNRPFFERSLARNVLAAARKVCPCELERDRGRFLLSGYDAEFEETLLRAVLGVFGVHSASPAAVCAAELEAIEHLAVETVLRERPNGGSFKVEARRADKSFALPSPEIAARLGGVVLRSCPGVTVDVHNPAWRLYIEVRDQAYLYTRFEDGPGGMPAGTSGKVMVLLSGGIDSPVAAWMMAKRGAEIEAVYFDSPPHTSERARNKVEQLCLVLSQACGAGIPLHVARFTEAQEEIYRKCPPDLMTILMRRQMMRIAEALAIKRGAAALVTGENLGQVASQTLESLAATDAVCDLPVFRPLIAFDKAEIVDRARHIGTYEISILPYEDCCTVFVPEHPATHPKIKEVERAERLLDVPALAEASLARTETIFVGAEQQ